MTLREQLHQAVDELDDEMLALIYEHIRTLDQKAPQSVTSSNAPTLEEVLEMTSTDKSSWSDELIAERHAGT